MTDERTPGSSRDAEVARRWEEIARYRARADMAIERAYDALRRLDRLLEEARRHRWAS